MRRAGVPVRVDRRTFVVLGFALLAGFDLWLTVFAIDLGLSNAPLWGACTGAAVCAASLALARRERAALLVGLGAHALLRTYFGFAGGSLTYARLLEIALAASLVAGTYAAWRERPWIAGALVAASIVIALFFARSAFASQEGAAVRQLLQLAAFAALVMGSRAGAPAPASGSERSPGIP